MTRFNKCHNQQTAWKYKGNTYVSNFLLRAGKSEVWELLYLSSTPKFGRRISVESLVRWYGNLQPQGLYWEGLRSQRSVVKDAVLWGKKPGQVNTRILLDIYTYLRRIQLTFSFQNRFRHIHKFWDCRVATVDYQDSNENNSLTGLHSLHFWSSAKCVCL